MARIAVAVMLGLALGAPGCSTSGSDGTSAGFDAAPVQGPEWQLVSLAGTPVIENGNKPTISFPEPGRIAGSASCNCWAAPGK